MRRESQVPSGPRGVGLALRQPEHQRLRVLVSPEPLASWKVSDPWSTLKGRQWCHTQGYVCPSLGLSFPTQLRAVSSTPAESRSLARIWLRSCPLQQLPGGRWDLRVLRTPHDPCVKNWIPVFLEDPFAPGERRARPGVTRRTDRRRDIPERRAESGHRGQPGPDSGDPRTSLRYHHPGCYIFLVAAISFFF